MSNESTQSDGQPIQILRVSSCGGDVHITAHPGEASVAVEGDAPLDRYMRQEGELLTISGYPDDLEITVPSHVTVELDGIGGDVQVRAGGDAEHALRQLSAHGIGGDLEISHVNKIEIGAAGGDVQIKGDCEEVEIGHVGGDLRVGYVALLDLKAVGGDARLGQIDVLRGLGHIGGDLELRVNALDGDAQGTVGGDASLKFADNIDLALVALVGGDFRGSGEGWNQSRGSGRVGLGFGHPEKTLRLTVGGDLTIRGGRVTAQTFGDARERGGFEGFDELRGLGRELEELGRTLARDLGNLGRDIAREVRVAGREAQREMREELKWGFGRRPPRVHVRVNDHEFKFDPEQIERIKRAAREAAAAGIARAQEAVEQALRQVQSGTSSAPRPPQPPRTPRSYTGQTVRIDREPEVAADATTATATSSVDRDAERLAILRMVHEGRLAPEDAEMLLRGLDR